MRLPFATLACVLAVVSVADAQTADVVYTRGKIYTVNDDQPWAEAVAIKDGKFAEIAADIDAASAATVHDGRGFIAFPGLVDAHMHTGIYAPLDEDARTESKAAAMGGVTTSINYMRTGKYYLNRGGSYLDFFPEVLKLSDGNFFVDCMYLKKAKDRLKIVTRILFLYFDSHTIELRYLSVIAVTF